MGFIDDINGGVMDRMLAAPVWRGALNLGSVAQAVIQILIQTLLIVLLALALGAHYERRRRRADPDARRRAAGAAFASLSNGLGVLTRQRESLIGAVTLVLLPLTFLSSALMQQSLAPDWIGRSRSSTRSTGPSWRAAPRRWRRSTGASWPAGRAPVRARRAAAAFATRAFGDLPAVALDEPVLVREDDGLHAVAEVRASAAGGGRAS
jgi:ABC-2 type transport system permease protein